MERSSPLAAVQPTTLPYWGCGGEALPKYKDYYGDFTGRLNFGPSSFNFNDISMERTATDYFSLKQVRGSSPTSTLAADLSSNFHIEQRFVHQAQKKHGELTSHP